MRESVVTGGSSSTNRILLGSASTVSKNDYSGSSLTFFLFDEDLLLVDLLRFLRNALVLALLSSLEGSLHLLDLHTLFFGILNDLTQK